MKSYADFIASAELFRRLDVVITTGDSEYPGTAIEVRNDDGEELFHIVVDSEGRRQIVVFARQANYRVPLETIEAIVAKANDVVRVTGES